MESKDSAEEVVTSLLNALNSKDLKTARRYLADNVQFTPPEGEAVYGADAYLEGWKKLGLSYQISKTYVSGDEDVCVLYDLRFNKPPVTIVGCGLYHISHGKVDSIKLIFNPRAVFPPRDSRGGKD